MFLYSSAVGDGGMCIPTFVDFFLFHLFFSLFLSFSFSFLSVSPVAGPYGIFFSSFSVRLSASFDSLVRSFPFFFSSGLFSLVNGTICNVTPSPHHIYPLLEPFLFLAGRWSTSGWGGNAHFFTATQEYDWGRREKIKQSNKHEQSLGSTKNRKRYCNTTFPCAVYY